MMTTLPRDVKTFSVPSRPTALAPGHTFPRGEPSGFHGEMEVHGDLFWTINMVPNINSGQPITPAYKPPPRVPDTVSNKGLPGQQEVLITGFTISFFNGLVNRGGNPLRHR